MRNRWVFPPALAECLLAFELLDEAWPRGRTAIERAEIGRCAGVLAPVVRGGAAVAAQIERLVRRGSI